MSTSDWLFLILQFFAFSFLAIGGAMTVASDMHRVIVDDMGLLSNKEFVTAIALGKISPGPNVMFVAVLGYQVGGLFGALALTLAIILPSTTLAYYVAKWGQFNQHRKWVVAIKAGFAPIIVGLLFSTGWIIVDGFNSVKAWILGAVVMVLVWRTRVHLLILICVGAILGMLGIV
jgi:chromate transporter